MTDSSGGSAPEQTPPRPEMQRLVEEWRAYADWLRSHEDGRNSAVAEGYEDAAEELEDVLSGLRRLGEGTYQNPCPFCGERLVGVTKEGYVDHLRENGEGLAAAIVEKLFVPEPCSGANVVDAAPRVYQCMRCNEEAGTELEMLKHLYDDHGDVNDGKHDYSVNVGNWPDVSEAVVGEGEP